MDITKNDTKTANLLRRIRLVCNIVNEHYEPGSHATCYKAIWRKYVNPLYPCSYRTFLRYIATPLPKEEPVAEDRQLRLF